MHFPRSSPLQPGHLFRRRRKARQRLQFMPHGTGLGASKPARRWAVQPTWKSAIRPVWKPGPRGRWVAGNRQRMGIRYVDAAGGANQGPGQAVGCVWEDGESFYGTRVGPGWYQSSAGVAKGCKLPFSVLRMLMQTRCKPPQSQGKVCAWTGNGMGFQPPASRSALRKPEMKAQGISLPDPTAAPGTVLHRLKGGQG